MANVYCLRESNIENNKNSSGVKLTWSSSISSLKTLVDPQDGSTMKVSISLALEPACSLVCQVLPQCIQAIPHKTLPSLLFLWGGSLHSDCPTSGGDTRVGGTPPLVARYSAISRYCSCEPAPIARYPSEGSSICDTPPLFVRWAHNHPWIPTTLVCPFSVGSVILQA